MKAISRTHKRKAEFSNAAPAISRSRKSKPDLQTSDQRISTARVTQSIRMRFSPIRNLTPALLSTYLDNFRLGYFRQPALAWDAMERRDDVLQVVAPKRKKGVARHGFEILAVDDSPAAKAQKDVLEYFYNNVTATNALEPDEQGGFSLLVRQMADAIGKRYAVHEIVWQPQAAGLTAQFRFCPLWWFEGTTGRLRFLENEFNSFGSDMLPGEWLVTVADGLMEACSVAYMFKMLPLRDWLACSEKWGMPGLLGKTDAPKGSAEWEALVSALTNFGTDWAAVCSRASEISTLEMKMQGDGPYKPLVEEMNRALTRLWMGSDLSTLSRDNGTGASLQGDESADLEHDDTTLLSETLGQRVSRQVLDYHFGVGSPRLAYLQIKTAERKDIDQDIKTDTFLLASGFPIEKKSAAERYGRPLPDVKGADLLTAPAVAAPGGRAETPSSPKSNSDFANELGDRATSELIATALKQAGKLQGDLLKPLLDRIAGISELTDVTLMRHAWGKLRADLPAILKQLNADPATAQLIADTLGAALLNGVISAEVKK